MTPMSPFSWDFLGHMNVEMTDSAAKRLLLRPRIDKSNKRNGYSNIREKGI